MKPHAGSQQIQGGETEQIAGPTLEQQFEQQDEQEGQRNGGTCPSAPKKSTYHTEKQYSQPYQRGGMEQPRKAAAAERLRIVTAAEERGNRAVLLGKNQMEKGR